MKAQMREANRQEARRVVIVGSDELEPGEVAGRDMASGEQEDIALERLADYLRTTTGETA